MPAETGESGMNRLSPVRCRQKERRIPRGVSIFSKMYGKCTDWLAERGGFEPSVPPVAIWAEFEREFAALFARIRASVLEREFVRLGFGSASDLSGSPSFARLMLGNPVTSNTERRFGACSSRNARSATPSIAIPSKGGITGHSLLWSRLCSARFMSGVASAADTPRAAAAISATFAPRFPAFA